MERPEDPVRVLALDLTRNAVGLERRPQRVQLAHVVAFDQGHPLEVVGHVAR